MANNNNKKYKFDFEALENKIKGFVKDVRTNGLKAFKNINRSTSSDDKTAKQKRKRFLTLFIPIFLFIIWYLLHVNAATNESSVKIVFAHLGDGFVHMFTHPFRISFTGGGLGLVWMVIVLGIVFGAIVILEGKLRKHDDLDTIAGDAVYMSDEDLAKYNRKRTEPLGEPYAAGRGNMIFSQDLYMSMNSAAISRNLNVFIIGGSGTGKSFRIVGPNILQRNCSMVITDPSGGLYKQYGPFLEYYGYKVKAFNLDHMELSNKYNPFNYIYDDKDIEILVTMIISNTTSASAKGGDDFWEKCEIALLCALIAYLFHYRPKEEQNFSHVKSMIRHASVDENDSSAKSATDRLFDKLRQTEPNCFALTQYDTFRLGAGKTLKSILISCAVRLQAFDLSNVRELTDTDNIELDTIADEKTAIFIIVPTGEKTFNFLAGLMYSQLFTRLYRYCENTAEFSWNYIDSEGELIRAFRAGSKKESKQAKQNAEAFFNMVKDATIKKVEDFTIKDNPNDEDEEGHHVKKQDLEFWGIFHNDVCLAYRGSKELAEQALESMKKGQVIPNSKTGNNGQRCPIHVRFLLDEFANTGKIPDFTEKISTIRKYEISTTIILQSLTQIQNLYEKEWSVISANCDTTIYLGGGNDKDTVEWIVALLGKKTVVDEGESYQGTSGSTSISRKSLDLISASQLRTLQRDEDDMCLVIPRSENAKLGPMYKTFNHPEWHLVNGEGALTYEFKKDRYEAIQKLTKYPKVEEVSEDVLENVPQKDTVLDSEYRKFENQKEEQKATTISSNVDDDGEVQIGKIVDIESEENNKLLSETVDILIGVENNQPFDPEAEGPMFSSGPVSNNSTESINTSEESDRLSSSSLPEEEVELVMWGSNVDFSEAEGAF